MCQRAPYLSLLACCTVVSNRASFYHHHFSFLHSTYLITHFAESSSSTVSNEMTTPPPPPHPLLCLSTVYSGKWPMPQSGRWCSAFLCLSLARSLAYEDASSLGFLKRVSTFHQKNTRRVIVPCALRVCLYVSAVTV